MYQNWTMGTWFGRIMCEKGLEDLIDFKLQMTQQPERAFQKTKEKKAYTSLSCLNTTTVPQSREPIVPLKFVQFISQKDVKLA